MAAEGTENLAEVATAVDSEVAAEAVTEILAWAEWEGLRTEEEELVDGATEAAERADRGKIPRRPGCPLAPEAEEDIPATCGMQCEAGGSPLRRRRDSRRRRS